MWYLSWAPAHDRKISPRREHTYPHSARKRWSGWYLRGGRSPQRRFSQMAFPAKWLSASLWYCVSFWWYVYLPIGSLRLSEELFARIIQILGVVFTYFNRCTKICQFHPLKKYWKARWPKSAGFSQELFFTHFGRKLGVNWRKLWRKRRQFWDNQ